MAQHNTIHGLNLLGCLQQSLSPQSLVGADAIALVMHCCNCTLTALMPTLDESSESVLQMTAPHPSSKAFFMTW